MQLDSARKRLCETPRSGKHYFDVPFRPLLRLVLFWLFVIIIVLRSFFLGSSADEARGRPPGQVAMWADRMYSSQRGLV